MKEKITFEHVATVSGGRVRIYMASKSLKNKANGKRYSEKPEEKSFYKNKEGNETVVRLIPTKFRFVAVSDAHTHIERLAFPCWKINPIRASHPYFWLCDTIAGKNTFMSHGGDSDAVKPDRVYLRMLATANGFQYSRGEK